MSTPQSGNVAAMPATTTQFLRSIFGSEWERAHLASFPTDPSDAGDAEWKGGYAKRWVSVCEAEPGNNNYFSVSLFTQEVRAEAYFDRLFVLGVDDVGTKIDEANTHDLLGEPTYRIETSSGNYQWFYVLNEPLSGVRRCRELIKNVRTQLTGDTGKDPGMEGVPRYLRLPFGTNTKKGSKFAVNIKGPVGPRLTLFRLTCLFAFLNVEFEEDAEDLGLLPRQTTKTIDTAEFDQDNLFKAFSALGMIQSGPHDMQMGRGFNVTCPWEHEHTGRATTGAAYVPVLRRFQCHHGHCQDKTAADCVPRLDEMLREESGGLVTLAALDFDELDPDQAKSAAARLARTWIETGQLVQNLARHQWVAPDVLMRGAVTMVFGPPNHGKSLLLMMWAVALALGAQWGTLKVPKPVKVLTLFAEEDNDEQCRRVYASLMELNGTVQELDPNLRRLVCRDLAIMFRHDRREGAIRSTEAWRQLNEAIDKFKPDVVILDPLVEFSTADENDNTIQKAVVSMFRTLAQKHNIAVVLAHHTRKSNGANSGPIAGTLDAARGASAIGAAVRIAFTLVEMEEKEAIKLGVPPERRRYYVRLDSARNTFSPPADVAIWFEKVSWQIANGDNVGALRRWNTPVAGVSNNLVASAMTALAAGCSAAAFLPWSPKCNDEPRSVRQLFRSLGIKSPLQEEAMLRELVAAGVTTQAFRHPGNRMTRQGLRNPDGTPQAQWLGTT